MFNEGKSKFQTTKSVQLATTRNYMEKRRLGQTILQYQKECKEIMKQLRDKRYSFLKAKYPHIIAMNSLHKEGIDSDRRRFNGETHLVSRPETYVERDLNMLRNNRKRTVNRLPKNTERICRGQESSISLPSLTKSDMKKNRSVEIKYVTTRLPPLDELHL